MPIDFEQGFIPPPHPHAFNLQQDIARVILGIGTFAIGNWTGYVLSVVS